MEGTPLLDVLRGLILEPEAQADFAADPSGYMQRFGYDDVPEDDLTEAVGLVADTLPADVAHAVNTAAAAPADDDLGEGSVGLLGRITAVEVVEPVVPPDDAELAADQDSTTFGDVTRDFDATEPDADDTDTDTHGPDTDDASADADGPDTDTDASADTDADGPEAGGIDRADPTDLDGDDAGAVDVSFGYAEFDDAGADAVTPAGGSIGHAPSPFGDEVDADASAEGFGQGSTAPHGADAFADGDFGAFPAADQGDPTDGVDAIDPAGDDAIDDGLDADGDAPYGSDLDADGDAIDDGFDADDPADDGLDGDGPGDDHDDPSGPPSDGGGDDIGLF